MDAQGNRAYYKLDKPVLPNHRIYDPNKEEQREDFYYSLLLLFKLDAGVEMKDHHDNLLKMLNVQSKVQTINQHRAKNEDNVTEDKEQRLIIVGEAVAAAMNDVSDINAVNNIDLDTRIAKLNKDQSHVFKNLTNVLFVGDILQLPSVNGQPVFARLDNKAIGSRLGCMASVNIWRDTVGYDELTSNEHQKMMFSLYRY